jgi:hypothetical protein
MALIALAGGGAGLVLWGQAQASRLAAQARAAEAAASKSALTQMREAERDARRGEPAPEPRADAATGRAMELNRMLSTAIDAADTPERRADLRGLLDRASVEADAGRLIDGPEAVATLRMTIGGGYRFLGEHALALKQLQSALAQRRSALGERHPDTIRAQIAVDDARKAAAGAK